MISNLNQNERFLEHVGRLSDCASPTDGSAAVKQLRHRGLARLRHLGIPSQKEEDWKYTDISPITAHTYTLAAPAPFRESDEWKNYCRPDEINIVCVNGIFSKELSDFRTAPKGIRITPWPEALAGDGAFLEELSRRYNPENEPAFVALNAALAGSGVCVDVGEGVVSDTLIHILYLTTTVADEKILVLPRTLIRVGASSEVTILESHLSFSDNSGYFSDALTDVLLSESAILHYCQAQKEGLTAYHIGCTRVWQERDSHFDGFSLTTAGALTRNDLEVILNGEGSTAVLNGLYCVCGGQHVDHHTLVDHRVPHGTSRQLYKGVLNDSARAVFNGKIRVRAMAQQTNSYQLNKNLLLGKDCRIDTKPQLEIFADDVKCTHGATIGRLNEDEIFYLQTRGIPHQEAVRLLTRGFVDDLLGTVRSLSVREKLSRLLESTSEVLR